MNTDNNTINKLKSKAAKLADKYGLDMILLFGSRADGTATKRSDVDIAYSKKGAPLIRRSIVNRQ